MRTVWCHRCRLEYESGTAACEECGGPLIDAPAPERRQRIQSPAPDRSRDAHTRGLLIAAIVLGIALTLSALMLVARLLFGGSVLPR